MKRSSLQNRVSKFAPKKYYEIDPRVIIFWGKNTLAYFFQTFYKKKKKFLKIDTRRIWKA